MESVKTVGKKGIIEITQVRDDEGMTLGSGSGDRQNRVGTRELQNSMIDCVPGVFEKEEYRITP